MNTDQLLMFDDIQTKIDKSVERVRDAYRFSQSLGMGKLWVAFSGGKDSVALYGVVKMASEKEGIALADYAELHYSLTTVDPPELVHFIKREFPFVTITRPKETMWALIVRKTMPPTRLVRYCCQELKEGGGDGRFCLTGVRWAESTARASRGAFESIGATKKEAVILMEDNADDRRLMEHCIPKKKYVGNPIIDWTDEDVWRFIRTQGLPYCSLYDEGFTRLGCIGCPMAGGKGQAMQFARYPKIRQAYLRAFGRMLVERKKRGLETKWKTGEEVMTWWLSDIKSFDEGNELYDGGKS